MKNLKTAAYWLVMIGAINWGLIGLGWFMGADWNVVHMLLSSSMQLEALVYALVGASAVWLLVERRG